MVAYQSSSFRSICILHFAFCILQSHALDLPAVSDFGSRISDLPSSPAPEYPYYGNAPADMLPYRNIEPYYRYWLTRLPFRGPGRDYPDPTNLTSLKVGLLSPPPYGAEAKRGEMSRRGVMLAFDEANARRSPGALPF